MPDLGDPVSYFVLEADTPVYGSDGVEIGTVEHVLAVPDDDIFDGIVIKTRYGRRFADAPLVDAIHERGVMLTVASADGDALPEPSANPGVLRVGPDDVAPDDLADKLKRAWNHITGKY